MLRSKERVLLHCPEARPMSGRLYKFTGFHSRDVLRCGGSASREIMMCVCLTLDTTGGAYSHIHRIL
jgi:hypothetical protein